MTVTGPRQSGKTTLCREAFPHLKYANLEALDVRGFAQSDPRGFLRHWGEGTILDEIQHVPDLVSYLQVLADEKRRNSLFLLTGSEHFKLSDVIGQSLAGRTALLRLLPLSMGERQRFEVDNDLDSVLFSGGYPRIFDQNLDPREALRDYFDTYVERDVRRMGGIRHLATFRLFASLCAGRVGQLLNLSSLGSDAGVSHTTARQWLGVLERSFILFRMQPYRSNIRKRLVKAPKLYFYDVGLASYLLGIESAQQMTTHPLRGSLFENAMVVEALKYAFNRGRQPNLSFFRDSKGLECDLLYKTGWGIAALEAKAGATVASDYFRSVNRVAELVPEVALKAVVYGGVERQSRRDGEVVPLSDLGGVLRMTEVEQEIAAFTREKGRLGPEDSDIETLDRIYRSHIWPMLTRLDLLLRRLAGELFRGIDQCFIIDWQHGDEPIEGLMHPERWNEARQKYLVEEGFDLSGNWHFQLKQECRLKSYTGAGRKGFNTLVRIVWEFGRQGFLRFAVVNGTRIEELDLSIPYAEADTRGPQLDDTLAGIGRHLIAAIERSSVP